MYRSVRGASRISLEEYERTADEPGYRTELHRGWLIKEPQPGALHGEVTGRLYTALDAFVRARQLGKTTCQTGFRLFTDPPTVRGPDVAFLRRARVPAEPPQSFWPFGPDLAVEVVSPGNSTSELQQKVIDYFDAGAELVWVIDPNIRTATVYRSLTDIAILREHETLDGGELLPGFTIALSELFAW